MLTPGTTLGPYRVLEQIGEGGTGAVYKARDTRLERTVALKLLNGPADEMAVLRERLQHEARSLSQLSHPHICTLFDIAEASDATGAPVSYLVMEYLEGETLAARILRGPLPLERSLVYGSQIADALDKAHRAGIIHGDLKPGNVMVIKSGVKLLDFGLARRRGSTLPPDWANAATRTASIGAPDAIEGTLQYLAPEQLEGHVSDERADIFACGAVIYEMLTGLRAFDGDSPAAVIAAIMRRELPSVSSVVPQASSAVDHAVATCLAKDPDDRWQHAGDLTRELRWLATTGAAESNTAPAAAARPSRAWQVAAGLLLLASLGLSVLLFFGPRPVEAPTYRTSILLPEGLRFPTGGTIGGGGRLALSPDGRALAVIVTDTTGRQMLWLRPLEGQTATPLAGTEGATAPFWSPDSRTIAFVAQGQLKSIDAAGGEPTLVATSATSATGAWNRNGEILFTPTAGSALAVVPAAGGAPRPVTTLDETVRDQVHRNPAFLPDGRHFLYVAVRAPNGASNSRRAVYAGSLDADTAPVLVVDNASGARYIDGHLLFLRDATLFAQPFDPARLSLSGEPRVVAEQVETGGVVAASFTVSDTGVLAYQASSPAGSQLVWFDRQGRQLGSVGNPADYGDVELSPDGRQALVSVLDSSTNTRDLWIVDVTRGVRTRFTFDKGDDIAPVWSRDGSRVMFTSNRSGHFDLYEKAASGIGAETLVYADAAEKYPTSWLSDARLLLYWTFSPDGTEVRVLPVDEHRPRAFLPSPVSPGRFAPDGRHVLYYSPESGRSEVYLVPFPAATRKWQISNAGGSFPRWRPDGREVFYIGLDNKLVATPVNAETDRVELGQPAPLFEARPIGARYSFDVAPGGERFLVNTVRGASAVTAVTLVQNWSRLLTP